MLSVIVPCTRLDKVRNLLTSLQNQTLAPAEVFIMLDGIKNDGIDLKDYNLTGEITEHEKSGPGKLRNYAMKKAKSDFLFVNDDVILDKDAVAYHCGLLNSYDASLLSCSFKVDSVLMHFCEYSNLIFRFYEYKYSSTIPFFYTLNAALKNKFKTIEFKEYPDASGEDMIFSSELRRRKVEIAYYYYMNNIHDHSFTVKSLYTLFFNRFKYIKMEIIPIADWYVERYLAAVEQVLFRLEGVDLNSLISNKNYELCIVNAPFTLKTLDAPLDRATQPTSKKEVYRLALTMLYNMRRLAAMKGVESIQK